MQGYKIIGLVPIGRVPGKKIGARRRFTHTEKQFIRDNWETMSDKQMAQQLGRPTGGVTNARHLMGLTNYSRNEWTAEEEQIVRDMYPDTPNADILKHLPRHGLYSLYRKANSLGLNKTREFMYQQNHRLGKVMMNHPDMIKNRIKKGTPPPNKGKGQSDYMSAEAIIRSAKTRFHKGHKPHNTKWDGAITIRHSSKARGRRPFVNIRLKQGKWKEYQIYLWEKVNGPVPEGHILRCRDGNTLNCHPSNWEPITRAEHARRNRNTEKAVFALKEYFRLNGHPAVELHDSYVAGNLAGGDKELRVYLIEHRQDLIKLARLNYKLRREVLKHGNK